MPNHCHVLILIVLVLRMLNMNPSVDSGALQVADTLTESQLVAVPPGTRYTPGNTKREQEVRKSWVAASFLGLMVRVARD